MVSLSPPYISEPITVKPKSTYGFPDKQQYTLLLPPIPQKMLPTLGARSFAAAPAPWSKPPAEIRNVCFLK